MCTHIPINEQDKAAGKKSKKSKSREEGGEGKKRKRKGGKEEGRHQQRKKQEGNAPAVSLLYGRASCRFKCSLRRTQLVVINITALLHLYGYWRASCGSEGSLRRTQFVKHHSAQLLHLHGLRACYFN
jgi:hypothetical protein